MSPEASALRIDTIVTLVLATMGVGLLALIWLATTLALWKGMTRKRPKKPVYGDDEWGFPIGFWALLTLALFIASGSYLFLFRDGAISKITHPQVHIDREAEVEPKEVADES